MAVPVDELLPPGSIIGGYRIERCIEPPLEGGCTRSHPVYEVTSPSGSPQRAALKAYRPPFPVRQRLLAELVALAERAGRAAACSSALAAVLAAGVDVWPDGAPLPWVATRWHDGLSLSALLARDGSLPAARALRIAEGVAAAQSEATAHGFGDFVGTPRWLLVDEASDAVTVTNLGYPRWEWRAHEAVAGTYTNGGHTYVHEPLCVDVLMSPDAFGDPRAQVSLVGLLVFFMLSGRPYWLHAADNGASFDLTAYLQELSGGVTTPASRRAAELGRGGSVDPRFDPWLARCCTPDRGDRYADVRAAVTALAHALGR